MPTMEHCGSAGCSIRNLVDIRSDIDRSGQCRQSYGPKATTRRKGEG